MIWAACFLAFFCFFCMLANLQLKQMTSMMSHATFHQQQGESSATKNHNQTVQNRPVL